MKYRFEINTAVATLRELSEFCDREKFLGYCKQCPKYGKRWVCPPYGNSEENILSHYQYLLLIGTRMFQYDSELSVSTGNFLPSFPTGSIEDPDRAIVDARAILDPLLLNLEKQHRGTLSFFAGTCFYCPEAECTRITGKPCIQPDKTRLSLEAIGFDVCKLSAGFLGIEIKWGASGDRPEYLTLVSALATDFAPDREFCDNIECTLTSAFNALE